jgi:hypothetical protein
MGDVMDQEKEKDLLYYCGTNGRCMGRVMLHNGEYIYEHKFLNVKTGESIFIISCGDYENLNRDYYQKAYNDIMEATDDFAILWKITGKGVMPLNESFNQIKLYYLYLLKLGISCEDINSILTEKYVGWEKVVPVKSRVIDFEKTH